MSYYQKKEVPPLFVEADKWIRETLKDEDHLYENGHSANGLERMFLRFLYCRIKAIVHSQKKKEDENFYEFDFEDVLSAVDDEYNDWIRQNKKARHLGAQALNELHRAENPGFEIGEYRTKHHPDFDKKEGGGVGRGSDYNNKRKNAEIRVEDTASDYPQQKEKKVATKRQGSPKQSVPDGDDLAELSNRVLTLEYRLGNKSDEADKNPPTANSRLKVVGNGIVAIHKRLDKLENEQFAFQALLFAVAKGKPEFAAELFLGEFEKQNPKWFNRLNDLWDKDVAEEQAKDENPAEVDDGVVNDTEHSKIVEMAEQRSGERKEAVVVNGDVAKIYPQEKDEAGLTI